MNGVTELIHRREAGIVVMIVYVIALNRLIWRPLYALAERKYRIN